MACKAHACVPVAVPRQLQQFLMHPYKPSHMHAKHDALNLAQGSLNGLMMGQSDASHIIIHHHTRCTQLTAPHLGMVPSAGLVRLR